LLNIGGKCSHLRAKPAHFAGHLPCGNKEMYVVNDLKVRQNRPQRSNLALKVRPRTNGRLPNELVLKYTLQQEMEIY
jgi:hypothetical protein